MINSDEQHKFLFAQKYLTSYIEDYKPDAYDVERCRQAYYIISDLLTYEIMNLDKFKFIERRKKIIKNV